MRPPDDSSNYDANVHIIKHKRLYINSIIPYIKFPQSCKNNVQRTTAQIAVPLTGFILRISAARPVLLLEHRDFLAGGKG